MVEASRMHAKKWSCAILGRQAKGLFPLEQAWSVGAGALCPIDRNNRDSGAIQCRKR